MSDTTKDLLQQGLAAARVGDIDDARRLLTQATQQMPENVDAWLGLAGVVDSLEYKQRCFEEVLTLEPDNSEAQAGLARVEKKMADQQTVADNLPFESGVGFCYRHPAAETGLRCNKCGKFICTKCAVRTPVGFRCPECIREQEDKYYSGTNTDYIIAVVIAFPLSLIAAFLFTFVISGFGFFFLMLIIAFFAAPAVAGFIAEAVRWGVGKRRSRYLRHVVVGCLIAATAPFLLMLLSGGAFFGMIPPAMLLFLGSATISARLR